jgi:hypothetical protein
MGDETPKLPETPDYSRATFEQVLVALTGLGTDLRAPLLLAGGGSDGGSHGWWVLAPESGRATATAGYYHAFETYYYGVNYNQAAFDDWRKTLDKIGTLIPQLEKGKLGMMDVGQVREAQALVNQYVNWLNSHWETAQSWIKKLDSPDTAFRGRAAYAVQQNLVRIAGTMKDLHDQITVQRNPSVPAALGQVADALGQAAANLAKIWYDHHDFLYNAVTVASDYVHESIHRYIWGMGLINNTDNYNLNHFTSKGEAETYINNVLAGFDSEKNSNLVWGHEAYNSYYDSEGNYAPTPVMSDQGNTEWQPNHFVPAVPDRTYEFPPAPARPDGFPAIKGDLRLQSTYDDFNAKIRDFAIARLAKVDEAARIELENLAKKYESVKAGLAGVYDNKSPTLGSPPPSGGGGGDAGDFPPPPGAGGGDGNNSFNPPGGGDSGGNYFNPPGGGNGGNGGGDFFGPPPDGNGGGSFTPPPDGSGGDSFNPFGGDGGGSFIPPPDGSGSGIGGLPYLPSAFTTPPTTNNANGGAGGFQPPPTSERVGLPPSGGLNANGDEGWAPPAPGEDLKLPPLTHSPAPSGHAGADLPVGGAGGSAAFTPPPGSGLDGAAGGAVTAGAGEVGAGLGGSGEGWADWSGDFGNSGAKQGLTPGTPQTGGLGMPMIPPMMGGMGGMGGLGGAGKERERERQTWLSEDEKVWGTENLVGSGVIGRPDGERVTDEPLAPRHVHVQAASRAKATDKRAGAKTPQRGQATQANQATQATEDIDGTAGTAGREDTKDTEATEVTEATGSTEGTSSAGSAGTP